jgi:hypothetical protein
MMSHESVSLSCSHNTCKCFNSVVFVQFSWLMYETLFLKGMWLSWLVKALEEQMKEGE